MATAFPKAANYKLLSLLLGSSVYYRKQLVLLYAMYAILLRDGINLLIVSPGYSTISYVLTIHCL